MPIKNQEISGRSPKQAKQPEEIEANAPAELNNRDSSMTSVGIGASVCEDDSFRISCWRSQ